MASYKVQELDLVSVPLPERTETYTPLPNRLIIDTVRENFAANNMKILAEGYGMDRTNGVFIGKYAVQGMEDNGINMMLGWMNSYDKSKRFQIGSGGVVMVCSNGMFISDLLEMTKHTSGVLPRFEQMVNNSIMSIENELVHLVKVKKEFETVQVSKSAINEILGKMFFEDSLVNTTQANIIKEGLTKDKNFNLLVPERQNLWSMYNLITESLKTQHPSTYFKTHIEAYNFIKDQIEVLA